MKAELKINYPTEPKTKNLWLSLSIDHTDEEQEYIVLMNNFNKDVYISTYILGYDGYKKCGYKYFVQRVNRTLLFKEFTSREYNIDD